MKRGLSMLDCRHVNGTKGVSNAVLFDFRCHKNVIGNKSMSLKVLLNVHLSRL